jgi:dolichol-phosphate mannosyltransferase
MEQAIGDAIVLIDGDLQDPPEIIPKFIKKWEEGYDIVYGQRIKRKASFILNIGYKLFYRLFKKLSYIDIPRDAGDFSLMDRKVIDLINNMPERKRFIRGLRAWVGFKSTPIAYQRDERKRGTSNVPFLSTFSWASLAIFSFSYTPLTFISWLAFLTTAFSGIAILFYLGLYFIFPDIPRGIPTIIIIVLFIGSVQLICFSIIAQYLAIMFEEIKGRPKYIIESVLNDHKKR